MISLRTCDRTLIVTAALALAAGTTLIGPTSPALAVGEPTATVGEVSCVAEDGTLTVTLEAGDSTTDFEVLVDGTPVGDDPTTVPADESASVDATGLEDGDHTVEVLINGGIDQVTSVAYETRTVSCDAAPVGPYSNPHGEVYEECEGSAVVSASNTPIGGNTDDLQPVTFTVGFTPTDDTVDGGSGSGADGSTDGTTDPAPDAPRLFEIGVETILDTFVLDASTQRYDGTFTAEELGGTGDLVLRAGEDVVATTHVGFCVVSPPLVTGGVENSGGVQALPDTGF